MIRTGGQLFFQTGSVNKDKESECACKRKKAGKVLMNKRVGKVLMQLMLGDTYSY